MPGPRRDGDRELLACVLDVKALRQEGTAELVGQMAQERAAGGDDRGADRYFGAARRRRVEAMLCRACVGALRHAFWEATRRVTAHPLQPDRGLRGSVREWMPTEPGTARALLKRETNDGQGRTAG
jgi:hypothetical protein